MSVRNGFTIEIYVLLMSSAISSDRTFHVLRVRHMMRMRIPSII